MGRHPVRGYTLGPVDLGPGLRPHRLCIHPVLWIHGKDPRPVRGHTGIPRARSIRAHLRIDPAGADHGGRDPGRRPHLRRGGLQRDRPLNR